jgi:hypothetical protein
LRPYAHIPEGSTVIVSETYRKGFADAQAGKPCPPTASRGYKIGWLAARRNV